MFKKNFIQPYDFTQKVGGKWLHRYNNGGIGALNHQRKGPNRIPHKIPEHEEDQIVTCRKRTPCYGPRRLKWAFPEIKAFEGAIARVLRMLSFIL